jgi:predicted small lipoprotein YifL
MDIKRKILLSSVTAMAVLSLTACGSSGGGDSTPAEEENPPVVDTRAAKFTGTSAATLETKFNAQDTMAYPSLTKETVTGDITANTTWTNDKIWVLDGLVAVKGATLTIEEGTIIAGKYGTGANSSYLVIDKDATIEAVGTADEPIIFTSETAVDGGTPDYGQWGGVTIIGTAANAQVTAYEVNEDFVADDTNLTGSSGTLKHVMILNSGITMAEDKEINGLSFVGVGSGTTVENITVDLSDDDGIELWGGTVDLTNVFISRCTDDHFDIDDGYSGTVRNLVINNTTGAAGIEMSGDTVATFDGFSITMNESSKEGALYFKKDDIGGHFKNGTISYNVSTDDSSDGAIHSKSADESSDTIDAANTSFENVSILGTK